MLAAGQGKRMHSDLPKVLHPLAGRPLLDHVLAKAGALNADRVVVVYGQGGDAVPTAFAESAAKFVLQEPQLGTGHAVQQAFPHLLPGGNTLVLYGDVPLTRRTAFMVGSGCGVLAGLTGAAALLAQSFLLFCLATLFAGLYGSVVQSFRFAAADGATPAVRPRDARSA